MYRVGPSRVERLSRSKVIAIVVFVFHWKWNWNLINVALWVCHCYCCCWRWVRTAATQQDCSTSNHNLPLMSICDDGKQKPILPTNWKCSTDFCTPKRFPPYVSYTNLDDFYWNRIHTLSEMIFFLCVSCFEWENSLPEVQLLAVYWVCLTFFGSNNLWFSAKPNRTNKIKWKTIIHRHKSNV